MRNEVAETSSKLNSCGINGVSRYSGYQKMFWLAESFNLDFCQNCFGGTNIAKLNFNFNSPMYIRQVSQRGGGK